MPTEFRDLIKLRKAELESQRTAMRAHLARIEAELAEIEQAERALPPLPGTFADAPTVLNIPPANTNALLEVPFPGAGRTPGLIGQIVRDTFANMTIKQLVRRALRDKHPNGMVATAMREYIRDNYGRDIEPNSLRPQLARLKAAGWILQSGEVWLLSPAGLLYDHPTSMNEKDEPAEVNADSSDEQIARWLEAQGMLGQVSIPIAREQLRKRDKRMKDTDHGD